MRRAILAVLALALVAVALTGAQLLRRHAPSDAAPPVARASVVGHTSDGWQLVHYVDVTVEVPPTWVRLDMSGCDYAVVHLGPPTLDPCSPDAGLWFFASATFDPAVGPGVHPLKRSRDLPAGGWGGYAEKADRAVDVGAADRATVLRILHSVHARSTS